MIRVTVELLPHGDESRKRHLGTCEIANDLEESLASRGDLGSYAVRLSKWGQPTQTWKRGRVGGFDRIKRGPWDLLYLALKDTVGYRNRQAA